MNIRLRDNFLDLWNANKTETGWEILSEGSLLCLKSPINCAKLQLCWGIESKDDLDKVYNFMDGKAFGYFEDAESSLSFDLPHDFKIPLPEMMLIEEDFTPEYSDRLEIKIVSNMEELDIWVDLYHRTSGMKIEDIQPFVRSSFKNNGHNFFIANLNGAWLGCADISIDNNKVGLVSSVGVLEEYRKQGFGKGIMNEAIVQVFKKGGKYAALYAYEHAVPFYEKIGFKQNRIWNFYIMKSKDL